MVIQRCESGSVKIFIAGCQLTARNICQVWVEKGHCVNVVDTDYIYKYGREQGVTIEMINYPRFPKTPQELLRDAQELGEALMVGLSAGSYTIVASGWQDVRQNYSSFYSRREVDKA
jgi:hypothetical protein